MNRPFLKNEELVIYRRHDEHLDLAMSCFIVHYDLS